MKRLTGTYIENNKAGSLVEVMVAIGVMVVALSGVMQVFLTSSLLSEMSGHITAAVASAQDKIEEIRGHDYDDITTDYGSGGTPGNTFTPYLLNQSNGAGAVTVTTSGTGLLNVQVVISWTEKNGRTMNTTLATNVAQRN